MAPNDVNRCEQTNIIKPRSFFIAWKFSYNIRIEMSSPWPSIITILIRKIDQI